MKMHKAGSIRLMTIAGLSLSVASCMTIAAGTSEDIRVVSDPAGANCRIQREGVNVAVIATTPGMANVARSKRDLTVTCTLAGMEDETVPLPAVLHGGTIGNAIAGGLIGVAVDAASGANFNYPEVTIVPLAPARFDSAAARDSYFAGQRTRVIALADAQVKRIMDSCPQSKKEFCAIEAQRVDEARKQALEVVERKRLAAKVPAG